MDIKKVFMLDITIQSHPSKLINRLQFFDCYTNLVRKKYLVGDSVEVVVRNFSK